MAFLPLFKDPACRDLVDVTVDVAVREEDSQKRFL